MSCPMCGGEPAENWWDPVADNGFEAFELDEVEFSAPHEDE